MGKEERQLSYKKAKERIENGDFLKLLQEESPKVKLFIKWLQEKRKFTRSKLKNVISK